MDKGTFDWETACWTKVYNNNNKRVTCLLSAATYVDKSCWQKKRLACVGEAPSFKATPSLLVKCSKSGAADYWRKHRNKIFAWTGKSMSTQVLSFFCMLFKFAKVLLWCTEHFVVFVPRDNKVKSTDSHLHVSHAPCVNLQVTHLGSALCIQRQSA